MILINDGRKSSNVLKVFMDLSHSPLLSQMFLELSVQVVDWNMTIKITLNFIEKLIFHIIEWW